VPGVDFDVLRYEITMEQVLKLVGFHASARRGAQWNGACPLHQSSRRRNTRCFSVNVATGRYYCHGCGSHGNQLDLWATTIKLPLHQAAIDLCQRLGREVPWIRRW
jgi:DNA primase